jgi:hypothetical protein
MTNLFENLRVKFFADGADLRCHIITAASDILSKMNVIVKNVLDYSLETVFMFKNNALGSGYRL